MRRRSAPRYPTRRSRLTRFMSSPWPAAPSTTCATRSGTPRASRALPRASGSRRCAGLCARRPRAHRPPARRARPGPADQRPALPRLPAQGATTSALPPRRPRPGARTPQGLAGLGVALQAQAVHPPGAHAAPLPRRHPRRRHPRTRQRPPRGPALQGQTPSHTAASASTPLRPSSPSSTSAAPGSPSTRPSDEPTQTREAPLSPARSTTVAPPHPGGNSGRCACPEPEGPAGTAGMLPTFTLNRSAGSASSYTPVHRRAATATRRAASPARSLNVRARRSRSANGTERHDIP